jgi:hypothetical protein
VLIVCASGLLLFLLYVSLRLLLAGPATIVFDQTHAFRAWPMTKPVWKSALLATIVLLGPALALGAWADWSDRKAWLEHGTSQSRFGLTIFGILLLIFYFLGIFLQHALAVSAWRAAQPAIAPEDQSG